MYSWPLAQGAVPETLSANPPIRLFTKDDLYSSHVFMGPIGELREVREVEAVLEPEGIYILPGACGQ